MIGLATEAEFGTPDGMWKDAYWVDHNHYFTDPAVIAEILHRHLRVIVAHEGAGIVYGLGKGLDLRHYPQLRVIAATLSSMCGNDLEYSMSAHGAVEENAQRLGLTDEARH